MQSSGVFRNASPIPLLVDEVVEIASGGQTTKSRHEHLSTPAAAEPKPVLLESIQILDPALRSRCLDLYADFDKRNQHDQFDTVIAEATRILEDRLSLRVRYKDGNRR
jgi:hypothetical protein